MLLNQNLDKKSSIKAKIEAVKNLHAGANPFLKRVDP